MSDSTAPALTPIQTQFAGCTHLKITTPLNPAFNEIVFGVKFNDGAALVSRSMPNRWGYTLEQLAEKFLIDLPIPYHVEGQWLEEAAPVKVVEVAQDVGETAVKLDEVLKSPKEHLRQELLEGAERVKTDRAAGKPGPLARAARKAAKLPED